ncbi:hypothetical protein [Nonomuraea sediminis]|uniref:hypothetical protein n=1 Tax=Nonomuraea sediminis TaxID=2835864 RepID=UPI001BDCAC5F|nr:hypothetical protein [Nonomuraea sediminis]
MAEVLCRLLGSPYQPVYEEVAAEMAGADVFEEKGRSYGLYALADSRAGAAGDREAG